MRNIPVTRHGWTKHYRTLLFSFQIIGTTFRRGFTLDIPAAALQHATTTLRLTRAPMTRRTYRYCLPCRRRATARYAWIFTRVRARTYRVSLTRLRTRNEDGLLYNSWILRCV